MYARGVKQLAAVHNKDRHPELVWDVPSGEDGVVEDHETSDDATDKGTTTKFIGSITRRDHQHKVDCSDTCWDDVNLGGRVGITSMVPESRSLWEEGIIVPKMKIASGGECLEDDVGATFNKVGTLPGCSATRRVQDNISNLKAQISANQRGIILLQKLCNEYTLEVVRKYMEGMQNNAEFAVRQFFKELAHKHPQPLTAPLLLLLSSMTSPKEIPGTI